MTSKFFGSSSSCCISLQGLLTLCQDERLKANPKKGNVIMLGGLYDLARSTNAGLSWQTNVAGIDTESIDGLYASVKPTPVVVAQSAGSFKKVFGYTNGKWSRLLLSRDYSPAHDAYSIGEVRVHPNNSKFIVTRNDSSSPEITVTRDGGKTWKFISAPANYGAELDPKKIGTIYLTSPAKSTDFGATWDFLNFNFLVTLELLRIDPTNTSEIYGIAAADLFKSENAGRAWKKLSTITARPATFILDLQIDPETPDTLYAAGFGGVFKSTDGGKTWNITSQGLPDYAMRFITINPFNHLNLFTAGGSNELFVSNDGAMTWVRFDTSGLSVSAIYHAIVDPQNAARLFVATDRGVFTSR